MAALRLIRGWLVRHSTPGVTALWSLRGGTLRFGVKVRIPAMTTMIALLPGWVWAAPYCERLGADTAFYCEVAGSTDEVIVCDMPDGDLVYVFGPPGAPELELQRHEEEVVYTPWSEAGPTYWAQLGFRNEGRQYVVGYSEPRDGGGPIRGYVDVYGPGGEPETGNPVESYKCRVGTVESRLDAFWERLD